MNCPECNTEMVKARATNFGPQYDYCRTCKKELDELVRKGVNLNLSALKKVRDIIVEQRKIMDKPGIKYLGIKKPQGNLDCISFEEINICLGVGYEYPLEELSKRFISVFDLVLPVGFKWEFSANLDTFKAVKE